MELLTFLFCYSTSYDEYYVLCRRNLCIHCVLFSCDLSCVADEEEDPSNVASLLKEALAIEKL